MPGRSRRRGRPWRTSRTPSRPAGTGSRRTVPSPSRAGCAPPRRASPRGRPLEVPVVPDQGEPGDRRDQGGGRPREQPPAPRAEVVRDRHRQHGGQGQPDRQRGGVDRGHQPHPAREVQLDQRGQQHVRGGHAGQAEQREQQEQWHVAGARAQRESDDHRHQGQQRDPVQPDQPGQPGCERPEQRERQHRQRGEHAGGGRRHGQAGRDLVEDRSDAHRRGAQVEPEHHDPDDHEQSLGAALGRLLLCRDVVGPDRWSAHRVILAHRSTGSRR